MVSRRRGKKNATCLARADFFHELVRVGTELLQQLRERKRPW